MATIAGERYGAGEYNIEGSGQLVEVDINYVVELTQGKCHTLVAVLGEYLWLMDTYTPVPGVTQSQADRIRELQQSPFSRRRAYVLPYDRVFVSIYPLVQDDVMRNLCVSNLYGATPRLCGTDATVVVVNRYSLIWLDMLYLLIAIILIVMVVASILYFSRNDTND